ncbi:unnamed protein product [Sympodiomycopsis kandeliae]
MTKEREIPDVDLSSRDEGRRRSESSKRGGGHYISDSLEQRYGWRKGIKHAMYGAAGISAVGTALHQGMEEAI